MTIFAKTWTKGHWPLDDLWPHICWGLMCDSTQGSLCPSPMKIHQSMWIQWPFLQKTWTKGHWPLDDLWPQSVEVTCVTLPRDHCVQVPWKYINVCRYSNPFCKNMKGHWPLDDLWPHICWGHMCDSTQGSLCPSPMGIHQCGYSDQFCKLPTKGHWPLDDLCPHICWGLMCDSTQGSLCPSPMKIHQSMWIQVNDPFCKKLEPKVIDPRWPLTPHLLRSHVWLYPRIIVSKSHGNTSMIQWSILQITTYIHILRTTYYIQNEWSHVSFWTTFRRDKNHLAH